MSAKPSNPLKEYNHLYSLIKSSHSFGKIKTWKDYLLAVGYDIGTIEYLYEQSQLQSRITWLQIKTNLEGSKNSLEIQAKIKNSEHREEKGSRDNKPFAHEYPIGNFYDPSRKDSIESCRGTSQEVESNSKERLGVTDLLEQPIDLPPSKLETCHLFNFQKKATKELLDNLIKSNLRAQLLIAGAGLGKTYIIGALIRRIIDCGFLLGKTSSPWPIVYVTKATVVEQTKRVFRDSFGLTDDDVLVINIEQMRAKFGELFVSEKTVIKQGEEIIKFIWRNNVFPTILLLDECQGVKNIKSIQSQIFQSYNDIDSPHTYQIYFSATPLTKVIEAKCFAVATRMRSKKASFIGEAVTVNNDNFIKFAEAVAYPAEPIEHSPAAVERLMHELIPYVVDVKGVRPQFRAINKVEIVDFDTVEDRRFYDSAWERWLKDKARFESEQDSTGINMGMCILAAFTKFCQAAELCKVPLLARRISHKLKEGFAPVVGLRFKTSIVRLVGVLVNDYKIPRTDISLIWGGKNEGKTKSAKKKELREKLSKHKDFLEELGKMGQTMEDLGLTTSDIAELMDEESERLNRELGGKDLNLGNQNKKARQENIDRFQSGKSKICIFTGKAGGVGLSLHHCDDMFKEKVRRKPDSNYAVEEDIPNIPLRPRSLDATPVYSAIELVQIFGRCPRLTSLSDTHQSMLFFRDTIEEEVAASVSMKLKCLKKVVRQKEHWEDLIVKTVGDNDYKKAREMIPDEEQTYEDKDDGTELFGDGGEDEEEEEE